ELAADRDVVRPGAMGPLPIDPGLTVGTRLPDERADDVAAVANDVDKPGAGKNFGDRAETAQVSRVGIVGVFVAPVPPTGKLRAIEVTNKIRAGGSQVRDKTVAVTEYKLVAPGQNVQRLMQPGKETPFIADANLGMPVENLAQVRRARSRRAEDDDRR